jgi:hypothetical protein
LRYLVTVGAIAAVNSPETTKTKGRLLMLAIADLVTVVLTAVLAMAGLLAVDLKTAGGLP